MKEKIHQFDELIDDFKQYCLTKFDKSFDDEKLLEYINSFLENQSKYFITKSKAIKHCEPNDPDFFFYSYIKHIKETNMIYFEYFQSIVIGNLLANYITYDEVYDCYICPNIKLLEYSITNKLGYKEYKSNPEDCKDCPFLKKCTQSKNHQKVVTRHVWEEYREEVMDEIRHTPEWKKLYPLRKESIERVFGDCKEHHNLRYTRLRGLEKNQHQALMIFACHNLKRMARWSWKTSSNTMHDWLKMMIFLYKTKKEKQYSLWGTALSTI